MTELDDGGGSDDPSGGFPCNWGHHSTCPHIPFDAALQLLPAGVRLDHLDPLVMPLPLCPCPCHADCALIGQPDGAGWPESCTCNGTLERRHQGRRAAPFIDEEGGLDPVRLLGHSLEEARKKRDARRRAAARGAARSRAEIGAILDEEWARAGLEPLSSFARRHQVERIVSPPTVAEQVVAGVRLVHDLSGAPGRLRRWWREVTENDTDADDIDADDDVYDDDPDIADEGPGRYRVATGKGSLEIDVDPSIRPRLGPLAARAVGFPSFARAVEVELRPGPDRGLEVWRELTPGQPAERLGRISPGDAAGYERPRAAAGRVGQRCVCGALVHREREGAWGLAVMRPLAADLPAGPGAG